MEQTNTCMLLLFLLGMLLVSYLKNSNPEIKLFQVKERKTKCFRLQMKTNVSHEDYTVLAWMIIPKTGILTTNKEQNFRNFQF